MGYLDGKEGPTPEGVEQGAPEDDGPPPHSSAASVQQIASSDCQSGAVADIDMARATTFGGWAAQYHRWRPTYPDDAITWLLPPRASRVVEVGAGTGKMTDRLVERGVDLDVVEPDGRMLDLVRERHPSVRTHVAGAAGLPLPDSSVDAVLVADAWHWFPKAEASAEAERVLRPGGWLGSVWNLVAPQQDGERELHGLEPARNASGEGQPDPLVLLGLTRGRAERRAFPWTWWVTPRDWRGFQSTVSRIALLPDDEREAVLDEAERRVAEACAATGRDTVPLHHEAVCFRWWPQPGA